MQRHVEKEKLHEPVPLNKGSPSRAGPSHPTIAQSFLNPPSLMKPPWPPKGILSSTILAGALLTGSSTHAHTHTHIHIYIQTRIRSCGAEKPETCPAHIPLSGQDTINDICSSAFSSCGPNSGALHITPPYAFKCRSRGEGGDEGSRLPVVLESFVFAG